MDPRIKRMARLLINYSCDVKTEDYVMIKASPVSTDLVLAMEEEVLKKGAYPLTEISLPSSRYVYYKYATEKQLSHFPHLEMHKIKNVQALISILDSENTKELANVDAQKQALRAKTLHPINDYIMDVQNKIKWCLTLFPTQAYAQESEMSLSEFQDFVFKALYCDKKDPIEEWKKISRQLQNLSEIISNAREVRIRGNETDLVMSIEGRHGVPCDGHWNMPDGEVFTSPIEHSVNGVISFMVFPRISAGREMSGVKLEFKDGKAVKASAEKGNEYLQKNLNIDEGARYIGELGIGANFGIKRAIKNILFDEKIGGTIHLALGDSPLAALTGGQNKSAIHWDFIFSLEKEGEILIDNRKLMVEKGHIGLE